MEGRESSGPSPEDMNFKSPESQPGKQPADTGKENADQTETSKRWVHSFNRPEQADKQPESKDTGQVEAETEKPLVELRSRDASKYTSGELFDNGQVKGVIERIDFMHNTIFVRPEKQEKPEERLTELLSLNVAKYRVGEVFDNGNVKGVIRRIDYMKSTIAIEEEHDKEKK